MRIEHLAISAGLSIEETEKRLAALGVPRRNMGDQRGRFAWARPWNPWIVEWENGTLALDSLSLRDCPRLGQFRTSGETTSERAINGWRWRMRQYLAPDQGAGPQA